VIECLYNINVNTHLAPMRDSFLSVRNQPTSVGQILRVRNIECHYFDKMSIVRIVLPIANDTVRCLFAKRQSNLCAIIGLVPTQHSYYMRVYYMCACVLCERVCYVRVCIVCTCVYYVRVSIMYRRLYCVCACIVCAWCIEWACVLCACVLCERALTVRVFSVV
jgi:hypothetical protein